MLKDVLQLHKQDIYPSSFNISSAIQKMTIMATNWIKKAFGVDLPQHKRAQLSDKTQDTLQIIGAGLPRSGTTSLKAALEMLGFDPCHHMSASLVKVETQKATSDTCLTGAPRPSPQKSTFRRPLKLPFAPVLRGLKSTSGPYTTPHAWLSCHTRLTLL